MNREAKPLLRKLLLQKGGRGKLFTAWAALFGGTLLLLLSLALWWNFRQVLAGRGAGDALGSSFLTLSKAVTDADMGQTDRSRFTPAEITDIFRAPQVQDAGPLTPAAFPVQASLGGNLGFSTLLFLEAAPDRFLDRRPEGWNWQEGDAALPILLSKDFLSTYNYVFAPSQGLPQLSENAVKAVGFTLNLGSPGSGQMTYRAQIVGFSDRIASVLVPQSFLDWANARFGSGTPLPARLLVRVADPSDERFVHFLEEHKLITNTENLRWNRLRSIVAGVSTGTGILALVLLFAGLGIFVLFLELTLARARDAVQLLLQIGYSPAAVRRFLLARFLPLALSAVAAALVLCTGAQVLAASLLPQGEISVPLLPGWPVWTAAGISAVVLALQIRAKTNSSIMALGS